MAIPIARRCCGKTRMAVRSYHSPPGPAAQLWLQSALRHVGFGSPFYPRVMGGWLLLARPRAFAKYVANADLLL